MSRLVVKVDLESIEDELIRMERAFEEALEEQADDSRATLGRQLAEQAHEFNQCLNEERDLNSRERNELHKEIRDLRKRLEYTQKCNDTQVHSIRELRDTLDDYQQRHVEDSKYITELRAIDPRSCVPTFTESSLRAENAVLKEKTANQERTIRDYQGCWCR